MAMEDVLRGLPQVDEVLRRADVAASDLPRWALVAATRQVIDARRRALRLNEATDPEIVSADVLAAAAVLARPSLRPVLNATGVVLHTNLGRAPLAARAIARVAEVARGYSNLEYELDERGRGSRHDHLRGLLAELTGAEAALVVNNNAAAVLVALAAVAGVAGRDVIVSRGELIEIGGSFRIPDVMRASGARLVEVGTTNKTHARDYEDALGEATALLLKVHRSNFAMVGFTAEVAVVDLAAIGAARQVPVMVDLGSGTLIDPIVWSLPSEPTPAALIAAGAGLVTFSGDKLLGGPQAGIIVGQEALIGRIRRHPLMRALRPDKLTLAALEATLELYREGRAVTEIPTLRMLAVALDTLRERAQRLAALIGADVTLVEVTSAVGGGALPTAAPRSWAASPDFFPPEALEAALRNAPTPAIARIANGRVLLDVRTLDDDDLPLVADEVRRLRVDRR